MHREVDPDIQREVEAKLAQMQARLEEEQKKRADEIDETKRRIEARLETLAVHRTCTSVMNAFRHFDKPVDANLDFTDPCCMVLSLSKTTFFESVLFFSFLDSFHSLRSSEKVYKHRQSLMRSSNVLRRSSALFDFTAAQIVDEYHFEF